MADEEKGKPLFETDSDIREMQEISDSVEAQRAMPQTEPQVVDLFVRPQAIRDSKYHHYLTKNLALSNLKESDVKIAILYDDCLNFAIYGYEMKYWEKDVPMEIAANFDTWLSSRKAINMEFFRLLVEKRMRLTKEEMTPQQQGRNKIFGRF